MKLTILSIALLSTCLCHASQVRKFTVKEGISSRLTDQKRQTVSNRLPGFVLDGGLNVRFTGQEDAWEIRPDGSGRIIERNGARELPVGQLRPMTKTQVVLNDFGIPNSDVNWIETRYQPLDWTVELEGKEYRPDLEQFKGMLAPQLFPELAVYSFKKVEQQNRKLMATTSVCLKIRMGGSRNSCRRGQIARNKNKYPLAKHYENYLTRNAALKLLDMAQKHGVSKVTVFLPYSLKLDGGSAWGTVLKAQIRAEESGTTDLGWNNVILSYGATTYMCHYLRCRPLQGADLVMSASEIKGSLN